MISIFTALAPVFIVILLGAIFKKKGMPGDAFWPYAERITYYVLLPCLFFSNVAHASFEGLDIKPMLAMLVASVVVMSLFLLAIRRILPIDGPSFTSVYQGGIRFNNYVGIPSAIALFGHDGLILSAILIALLVPIINSTCVAVLSHYGSHDNVNLAANIKRIVTNPLILACLLGGVVNVAGIPIPEVIDKVLDVLSKASLAFGLLTVGAGLDIQATKGLRHIMLLTCFLKLLLFPIITGVLCLAFEVDSITSQISILYAALPAASSSYIMARQMGGNAYLMAGIMVMQTILAAVTMPLVLIVSRMVF